MKKLSLKVKKVMAKILKVIAVILIVIGIILLLPWMVMTFWAIFTHLHHGMVEMSDNLRLFYLGWMLLGGAPVAVGGSCLLWAENILQRIRWRNEVVQR